MPFTKGDPNINRKGRIDGGDGFSITKMVRDELAKVEPKTQKTWGELVIKRILLKATSEGDVQMLKAIWAYMDGMPVQSTDLTSGGDKIQRIDIQTLLEKAYGTNIRNEDMSNDSKER